MVGQAVSKSGASTPLDERWNGTRWRIQATPNPPGAQGSFLDAVSCTSVSACTAVGAPTDSSGNVVGTLAERWNGTRWTIQPTPNPAVPFQPTLDSVACPVRRFCTAVGDYGVNGTGAERLTLGLQWRDAGQGPQHPAAPPHPGASCAGRPAALDRLPWGRPDAGELSSAWNREP